MYMECRHIKTNGLRCESPALKGRPFCYYHSKVHTIGAEPNLKYGPLQLPSPEDRAAIQLSVARINDAVINSRIDLKKAASLYEGLKIAARFIDPKKYFHEAETVQSAEQCSDGDELAPLVTNAMMTTTATIVLTPTFVLAASTPTPRTMETTMTSSLSPLFSALCFPFR